MESQTQHSYFEILLTCCLKETTPLGAVSDIHIGSNVREILVFGISVYSYLIFSVIFISTINAGLKLILPDRIWER